MKKAKKTNATVQTAAAKQSEAYKLRLEVLRPAVYGLCEDVITNMGLNIKLYNSFRDAGNFYMADKMLEIVDRIICETITLSFLRELSTDLKGTFATTAAAYPKYTGAEGLAKAYCAIKNLHEEQTE